MAARFAAAVRWRRDLHRHPQPGWLEFYATGLIAAKLTEWGYHLQLGRDIIDEGKHFLLPNAATLQREYERALEAGVKEEFIAPARGGFTGVVGTLKGSRPGPTVGFRFDIDGNEVTESTHGSHRPAAEGFASRYPGYAHMCGHDAHAAMGLLLALYFAANRDRIRGTVKFFFQPNEENLCGAWAMTEKGLLDDLDYLFGGHVGVVDGRSGTIALDVHSFLALSRFEVTYTGRSTHAGLSPQEGKNALLGACAAVTNLHAVARHGRGPTRINVGTLEAGTTWNVIPERAFFRLETRGINDELNTYMVQKAGRVLEGAAVMYDLILDVKPVATAPGGRNSPELVALGTKVARRLPSVREVIPEAAFNASEDFTVMMKRVQERGGKALFVLFGTPTFGGHHSSSFDIDEEVIMTGSEFLAAVQAEITA